MKILVLSPHTDDAEIYSGATIYRLNQLIHDVTVIAFSTGNSNDGASYEEFSLSMRVLGVRNYDLLNFPARMYQSHRQEILQWMIDTALPCGYDMIFCPSPADTHQDHSCIGEEAVRAFEGKAGIFFYDNPRRVIGQNINFFTTVDEDAIRKKVAAISEYTSQYHRMDKKAIEEYCYSLATIRGVQCGKTFAEGFELRSVTV